MLHLMSPGCARFILGDHPRADALRGVEHRPTPVFAAHSDHGGGCWMTIPTAGSSPRAAARMARQAGGETISPPGFGQDWLATQQRHANFDLDQEWAMPRPLRLNTTVRMLCCAISRGGGVRLVFFPFPVEPDLTPCQ